MRIVTLLIVAPEAVTVIPRSGVESTPPPAGVMDSRTAVRAPPDLPAFLAELARWPTGFAPPQPAAASEVSAAHRAATTIGRTGDRDD